MYNPYQNQGYQSQGSNAGYTQYGQQYGQFQQYGQPQQPGLFQGQQTGFQPQAFQENGQFPQGFQPQQTGFQPGFQGGQNQAPAQQTGFGAQNQAPAPQTGFQSGFQPQQTGFQPQQTGFQPQQTGFLQPLQAQPTGFSAALAGVQQNTELKIPNIRLSFITASDQVKFENLFRTAVSGGENALSGDTARDILLKSGLSPVTLAEVWALSDTNKLGLLLFPEFALALHLCNLALKGDALPRNLPEKWLNEVQSFVDAISFLVPEDPNAILANTPFALLQKQPDDWMTSAPPTSFTAQPTGGILQVPPQRTGGFQPIQGQQTGGFQPIQGQQTGGFRPVQSQQTGGLVPLQAQHTSSFVPAPLQSQATGPLKAQNTGFSGMPATSFQAQQTGGFQPIQPQTTGFQAQQTGGFHPIQPQTTGYQSQPIQPQTTGFQAQNTGFQAQNTGFQPQNTGFQNGALQAQPTGKPGQWGFVSTPTGGLPGLNAMQLHFLPSSQQSSNNLQNAMGGSLKENVTWAITKQEKQIYDGVFAAWDKSRKGFIDGDVAITIFSKSGLGRPDLESIWNLCDDGNRGKLNKDEFAVAMHLVYRRLNGLEIPVRLPPELVPPSAKYLQDSVDSLKNSLKGGNGAKKAAPKSTSASRFKNDDDELSYVSNSRRRSKAQGTKEVLSKNDLTISDLKKLIREKQILLDATDLEDQHKSITGKRENEANMREIESLKGQISQIQAQLTSSGSGNDEKAQLLNTLNHFTKDKVPSLISRIHRVNVDIAQAKTELAKKELKREYPSWDPENSSIEATGPNGTVTESDRQKAKSKQLLRQRMAALTGKLFSEGTDSDAEAKWHLVLEKSNKERDDQSGMIKDIEASIKELEESAASHLQVSVKSESDTRKWEKGEGVSSTVKTFIEELKAFGKSQVQSAQPFQSTTQSTPQSSLTPQSAITPQSTSSSVSSKPYKTPEERSAYIKAQAEKRMNERLAKLGISRNKGAEKPKEVPEKVPTPVQVQEPKPEPRQQKPEPVQLKPEPVQLKPEPVQQVQEPVKSEEKEEESDDEEYQLLLKQKAEMESRKKERALKKAQEKEARLAKLKEEMKKMNQSDDDWSDDDLKQTPLYTPSSVIKEVKVEKVAVPKVSEVNKADEPEVTEVKAPAVNEPVKPVHESNPFAKTGASKAGTSTNPFFKSTTATAAPVNQKKLEAQRASQRGMDSEDWSDDEQKSSDDDEPNRAGAAKLATLLFGGMPQPARSESEQTIKLAHAQVQEPVQTAPIPQAPQAQAPAEAPIQAPPIPQAPIPVPVQSTGGVLGVNGEEFSSTDDNDEFATPSPELAPTEYDEVPLIPMPPAAAPPPPMVPPPPMEVPPALPGSIPPPPPMSAPSAPPPPPMNAPPPMTLAPAVAPAGGLSALLGQIQGGKALKKVDDSQKRVAENSVAGKVLD